jgi:hypothetical protein
MAKVTILQPGNSTPLKPGQPVAVTGSAIGKGGVEPDEAETVTVSVDGGPPVEATVTVVPHQQVPTAHFTAEVQAPGNTGLHEIFAVATYGSGTKAGATVTVLVQGLLVPAFTPQQSLQISSSWVNPEPPSAGDWATDIVKANKSPSPILPSLLTHEVMSHRGDDYPACAREWNQVTSPAEDRDQVPAGFSGWVLQPEISGDDVAFTHPFGFDWECMVALDPEYAGLLAPGNAVDDGLSGQLARHDADTLHIKIPDGGLLAVETDSACVPSALKPPFGDNVRVGDRIAVFGRWIVDAGHHVQLPSGNNSYRAEVHPPVLMAIGGTRRGDDGESLTRIVLTSRPYLVKQVYTRDTSTIYDDSAPDDGTLLEHLNRDVERLHVLQSVLIGAHPKIASMPFAGANVFQFSVRPPPANVGGVVQVSFQFTCRSGVVAQVLGQNDHVDLLVLLNGADYAPPPLPERHTDVIKGDRLEEAKDLIPLEELLGVLFQANDISTVITELALAHGIETDRYDVPDVDPLDRSHAVPFVHVNQIPGGRPGVVIDDSQPYPVFGFLEIRWHPADVGNP